MQILIYAIFFSSTKTVGPILVMSAGNLFYVETENVEYEQKNVFGRSDMPGICSLFGLD